MLALRHVTHVLLAIILLSSPSLAQEGQGEGQSDAALSQELQNPIANLINVPLQNNFDWGLGPNDDGFRYTLNVQPIIPFELNPDLLLITRTILPIIHQEDVTAKGQSETGLSDTVQSFFFSPKSESSLTWGVGPVFLWPTATDDALGARKWGAGPTAVALQITGGWTYGILANHIWSYAGDDERPDVSATFFQPFGSYTFANGVTLLANLEGTYDWERDDEHLTLPVNAGVSKVFKIGGQAVSLGALGRYYIKAPDTGPDWGMRLVINFVFPR